MGPMSILKSGFALGMLLATTIRVFFSARPKKYIKQLTSSVHRAKERIILHSYQYSEDGDDDIIITSYKKNADPWDIDWFRD